MIKHFLRLTITSKNYQKMSYYAVARGRAVGIFPEWHMCDSSVRGFKGARYKKFKTRELANEFLRENGVNVEQYSNDSHSESNTSGSEETNKEFWPDDDQCLSGDEDFLLAAADEVEGISSSKVELSRKRKTDLEKSASSSSKKSKTDITIIEAVGKKKYGGFLFPIDAEGYVICYTDGSCENNGQKNPVAGFGVYFSENHPMNTAKPVTGRATNNVGEIQASIYAIQIAKDLGIMKLCICTDSQFLINSITNWIKFWKKNRWRTKSNQPVKNIDEFKELDELISKKDIIIKWHHVRGHNGILGNEMADSLARAGAQMYRDLHK